jgi:hypothetical protein
MEQLFNATAHVVRVVAGWEWEVFMSGTPCQTEYRKSTESNGIVTDLHESSAVLCQQGNKKGRENGDY